MNTPRLTSEPAAPIYLVHSGVKGARRTTWRAYSTSSDAHAFANRVRSSNSIGSYWSEVYPSPRLWEGPDAYRARTGIRVGPAVWLELLTATVDHLDSARGAVA